MSLLPNEIEARERSVDERLDALEKATNVLPDQIVKLAEQQIRADERAKCDTEWLAEINEQEHVWSGDPEGELLVERLRARVKEGK